MSPEQALGQSTIDHTTDIWSFGIIAAECLTGVRPFDGETLGALLVNICHHPIPSPSTLGPVPPGFDAWFARATNRDQKARFQSAAEASAALRSMGDPALNALPRAQLTSVIDGQLPQLADNAQLAQTAGPASMTIPGLPSSHPRRAVFFALPALALLVAAGALGWQQLQSSHTPEVSSNATSGTTLGSTHAETSPTVVPNENRVDPAPSAAINQSAQQNRSQDAGTPVVLVGAQSPSPSVSAAPATNRAVVVARPAKGASAPKGKQGARVEPELPQPAKTNRISNNAAGF
jgi:serine/threonine-protein kinase